MALRSFANRRSQSRWPIRFAVLALGFGLLAQVQPVAAAGQGLVPATTGPAAASAEASRLVAQLATDRQPAVAFTRLAPMERQAVVRFLSVASTGTTRQLVRRSALAGPLARGSAGTAPGAGCWTWRWERDAWNLFGLKLWAYFQEIDWCDDGSTLVRDPQLLNYGATYFPFWTWVHAGDHTWGGAGQAAFRSWTQADFSLCLAPNIGCIQNTYPWLDMTVHANGTGTGSVG